MSLLNQVLDGIYLGILTGIFPALVAWVLGFIFKYFTDVTLPGFGVVVLGAAIAGVQGGLLGLVEPTIQSSPTALVALLVIMMLVLYSHSKGDKMGANFPHRISIRSLGKRTLSSDVVERIGAFGQVRVKMSGEVGDIEGYPPLTPELRAELRGREWSFPGDLPLPELEKRLRERLVNEYDFSEAEVSIDEHANASINAAPPLGGLSSRLTPGRRAVSVDTLVPTGIARGDEVVVETSEFRVSGMVVSARSDLSSNTSSDTQSQAPSQVLDSTSVSDDPNDPGSGSQNTDLPQSALVTRGGDGRVTVSVTREAAQKLLNTDTKRIVVKPRGKRREFELVSLLRQKGNRFSKSTVALESELVGKTIGEANVRDAYGVVLLALRRSGEGEGWIVAPRGSTSINAGDEIFFAGNRDAVQSFEEVFE